MTQLPQTLSRSTTLASPIGLLRLEATADVITAIRFVTADLDITAPDTQAETGADEPLLHAASAQLQAYFDGQLKHFDLPLARTGTAFQQQVWGQLQNIPYGQSYSYSQLAQAVENPKACRAVGLANRSNPFAIVVPCHRVIGADGRLTGYAGGLQRKQWLLQHEHG